MHNHTCQQSPFFIEIPVVYQVQTTFCCCLHLPLQWRATCMLGSQADIGKVPTCDWCTTMEASRLAEIGMSSIKGAFLLRLYLFQASAQLWRSFTQQCQPPRRNQKVALSRQVQGQPDYTNHTHSLVSWCLQTARYLTVDNFSQPTNLLHCHLLFYMRIYNNRERKAAMTCHGTHVIWNSTLEFSICNINYAA